MQLKPKRLGPGARIGIVNPAYWLELERRERAVGVFEKLGYELVLGKSTELVQDKYAGSADMAMFTDPTIDAIICARGGYGGNRVLPLLDFDVIRKHPKIFIGFSDITGFLASMSQQSGLVTFHGPMLTTYGKQTLQYHLDVFHDVLSGRDDIRIQSPDACRARTLKSGIARGPLWGGNLSLVIERLGTPEQIDTQGAILFLEEIDEELYAFVIIGEMLEMGDSGVPFGKSVDEIVLDVCEGLDFPIISNFPCGHGDYQATLPVSHEVELHAEEDPTILIPESPVS